MARAPDRRPASGYEEIVGYHLEQAYLYRSELGPVDDATRRSRSRRPSGSGLPAAERSCAATPGRGQPHLARGRTDARGRPGARRPHPNVRVVQGLSGDLGWAERVLTDAVATAVASDDRGLEAHALVQRGFLRLFTQPDVEPDELLEVAERAIAVFEELGDELGLTRAWRLAAQAHYLDRRAGPCAEASERALEYGRRAGDHLEGREIVEWLCVATMLGPTPGLRCRRQVRKGCWTRSRATPILEPTVLAVHWNAGRDAGALTGERAPRAVAARCCELGDSIWLFAINFGLVLLANDPVAAEPELRPGYEALRRLGEKSHYSSVTGLLARAMCAQGATTRPSG